MTQAASALNVPYHAILGDIEAPLQKDMSAPTLARFKAKPLVLTPGAHGQSDLNREARTPLVILLAVTGVVLLIACANVANLLLARSASRATEMAVRLSIGASRFQLIRQLLLEACLLALMGGGAGLLVAKLTLSGIHALMPPEITSTVDLVMEPSVFLAAAVLSIATGILFGLYPAIHSTRPDLASTLKGSSGQPAGAKAAARFRWTLATSQIALSMTLLATAGLFAKSLVNVDKVDLGLNVERLVTFRVSPDLNGYTSERTRGFFEQTEDALRAMPGVTGVTVSMVPLLEHSNWGNSVSVEGFKGGPDVDQSSNFNNVGAGYFRTLGIPLKAGREFTAADRLGTSKVAIVNEAFAKKFHLGRDAVGKFMSEDRDASKLDIQIVGLVQDAKYSEVKAEVPPLFFRPYLQNENIGSASFYVRTAGDPASLLAAIPRVMKALDPALPLENLAPMPEVVRQNVFVDRFMSTLSATFAGLATLLAAIGLYGVLSYTVALRTREFGLRMALGASPAGIRSLMLRQVAVMTAVGGAIGLTAAVFLGKASSSLLFKLESYDPVALATTAVVLSLVALGAGFLPAWRASRIDPMTALRYE